MEAGPPIARGGPHPARAKGRRAGLPGDIRIDANKRSHSSGSGDRICRDGPPRMVGRWTWSGRERSSHNRFPPVPRVGLVTFLLAPFAGRFLFLHHTPFDLPLARLPHRFACRRDAALL